MSKAQPFSWCVRFTVAPLWIQDGFTIDNDRALSMLAHAVGAGSADELQARVIEAPSALQIARMQGYGPQHPQSGRIVREILAGHGETGQVRRALIMALDLLDSVAFVANEGDTNAPIDAIHDALAIIDARQGEPVEIEQ